LLVAFGLPTGQSVLFNYSWTTQYSLALSWTNPLPRYLPELWAGFGGYDFFFYAPLPFWFIAAVVDPLCPGCQSSTELVLGASVFLVASGVSMFAFLRAFFAPGPAAFGAIIFVVLPYHLLVNWVLRQAVGEFAAYAFIPLVALGIERVRRGARGGWLLAIGVAGTALSHLPTTLLAAHVFGLLVLVLAAFERGGFVARLRLLARFAWFAVLGLALASFYWLPAVMLLDTVSPEVLFGPYYEAWRWLFLGASSLPDAGFALVLVAVFLACLPILLGSILSARGPLLAWILVPVVLAVVLNTVPSEPIWQNWIIAKVQFPWRLMVFVDLATGSAAAVLAAGAVRWMGWCVLLVALTTAVVPAVIVAATLGDRMQGSTAERELQDGVAAMEYFSPEMTAALRRRLDRPGVDLLDQTLLAATGADMAAEFAETYPPANIQKRRSRSLTVVPPMGAAVLSLPIQYWFLWSAETATGTALDVRPNPTFGTLDIAAPIGGFNQEPVIVSLRYHPSELAGAGAFLLAMFALFAGGLGSRRSRP
jgi:hypothetical protein